MHKNDVWQFLKFTYVSLLIMVKTSKQSCSQDTDIASLSKILQLEFYSFLCDNNIRHLLDIIYLF